MEKIKVVVISGVTSGIGKAAAKAFVNKGYKVIGLGRREDKLNELKKEFGSDVFLNLICDVTDFKQIENKFSNIPEIFKNISVLVNNAGLIKGVGRFDRITGEDFEIMIKTNVLGVINLTKYLFLKIKSSGCGHLVNITSIAAHYAYNGGHVYASSKAFVEHFGRNLLTELSDDKVRVTNISPGKTKTDFFKTQFNGDNIKAEKVYNEIAPLQPEDIANSIVWAVTQPDHVNISSIEIIPSNNRLSYK